MAQLSPLAEQLYQAKTSEIADALRYLKKADEVAAEIISTATSRVLPAYTLTCVYCGHQYPADTPASGAPALTEHIRICEKHPLRQAEANVTRLRAALAGLIGNSDPTQLKAIRTVIECDPRAPAEEKLVAINAINTLIETAPEAGA